MKLKALTDCNGYRYEHFTAGEVREVAEETAELLVSFGYVEVVEEPAEPEKEPDPKQTDTEEKSERKKHESDDETPEG